MRLKQTVVCPLLCGSAVLIAASPANAAFIEDSKASVDLRNFYMNRDFRSGDGQSKAEEWAQGFMLKMESGYTEGPIGFGLDAIGLLGVKLDSSPDRVGTGILQSDREAPNRAQDDYGSAGLTAKARLSQTTLHVGTMQPLIPVLMRNDSRLLPQTFRGAWLQSKEIDGLTLDVGRLDRVNQRNSSDNEEMTAFNGGLRNIRFGRQTSSDEFLFAGGRYAWTPELSSSYYYGGLDGIYKEHNLGLLHVLPLGDKQSLKTDLRYVRQTDDGGSNVDADTFGAMFTYRLGGHAFGTGYQQVSGDTGFAYIAGSDNSLLNLVQINDLRQRGRTLLAGPLRLRLRRPRHPRPDPHDPLPLRRQRRPRRGSQRRQDLGAQHRHRLRVPERPAEKPRPETAQRHHPQQFPERPGREPRDHQLQRTALVSKD